LNFETLSKYNFTHVSDFEILSKCQFTRVLGLRNTFEIQFHACFGTSKHFRNTISRVFRTSKHFRNTISRVFRTSKHLRRPIHAYYLAKLIEKRLRLKELEREAYERRDGKGGYDEATEEAIKKLMAESAANEPFSFCLNCGWKGNFVIRGTSCPDCQEYNVLNTVKYPRLHAEWLEACINVAKSDVVPRPYQVRAEHDNAVLMVEVPTELQKQVRAIASNIPEKQLTPEGVEEDTHITLLYGIPDTKESIRDVKELIDRWIRMSNDTIVSYFDNPDASVAKLSVKSTDLRWAHAVLKSKVANKHGHFFNPHITIAYLKPGEKISEDIKVPKLAWIAKNIVLSHRDGAKEVIALQNRAW